MTSKRLHLILLASVVLLFIGLVGGVYGINKLLTGHTTILLSLKAKSQALAQEQQSFTRAKQSIEKYAELEKIAHSVVPADKSQAEAVQEIVNIAGTHGVKLSAITFPASTLGATTGSSSTAAPSSSTNAATNRLSQLQPVKNIAGIYQLLISVNSDPNQPVAYDKLIGFLDALEHNRRTAQVGSITIAPSASNRNLLTFTLTLSEYIKP